MTEEKIEERIEEELDEKTEEKIEEELDEKDERNLDALGIYLRKIREYHILNQEEEREKYEPIQKINQEIFEIEKEIGVGVSVYKGLIRKRTSEKLERIRNSPEKTEKLKKMLKLDEKRKALPEWEEFFKDNLRLPIYVAKEYRNKGAQLPLLDLIQEGNLGLLKAMEKFDMRNKTEDGNPIKFSTYAVHWIRYFVKRALEDQTRTIRIPGWASENLRKIKNFIEDYRTKYRRNPGEEEISDALDIDENMVRSLIYVSRGTVSLDQKIENTENIEFENFLKNPKPSPTEQLDKAQLHEGIIGLLYILSNKERDIIIRRFGLEGYKETLDKIAEDYGLTRERIRQIQEKAIGKLKKQIGEVGEEEFREKLVGYSERDAIMDSALKKNPEIRELEKNGVRYLTLRKIEEKYPKIRQDIQLAIKYNLIPTILVNIWNGKSIKIIRQDELEKVLDYDNNYGFKPDFAEKLERIKREKLAA